MCVERKGSSDCKLAVQVRTMHDRPFKWGRRVEVFYIWVEGLAQLSHRCVNFIFRVTWLGDVCAICGKVFSKVHKGQGQVIWAFTAIIKWKHVGKRNWQFHHRRNITVLSEYVEARLTMVYIRYHNCISPLCTWGMTAYYAVGTHLCTHFYPYLLGWPAM